MTPPFLGGGQGRSRRDVRRDGSALAFSLLVAVVLAAALVLRACAGGAP